MKGKLQDASSSAPQDIRFVKTKDKQKVLMCHIIAISLHLSSFKRLRASIFARVLKKDIGELKNFFKEIGLTMEACKNEKTGEPDVMLYLTNPKKEKQE
mgnify:CR=1 FL=1